MSEPNKLVASLYGGPGDQQKLWVEENPAWPSPWPGYLCLNMREGMPQHYTLISNGIYHWAGPCIEFDHDPELHQQRCPDCGAKIIVGQHREHNR